MPNRYRTMTRPSVRASNWPLRSTSILAGKVPDGAKVALMVFAATTLTAHTATPLASVTTLAALSVAAAPEAGAEKVTVTPGTTRLVASRIVTLNGCAKDELIAAA